MSKANLQRLTKLLSIVLDSLDSREVESIIAGNGKLIYVQNHVQQSLKELPDIDLSVMVSKLTACNSREDARLLLSNISNKDTLTAIAKEMKVHIVKNDRRDEIENKIIEFAIGGTLRTEAINTLNLRAGNG